jgi:3,4-dihydroxy 2-butanone 4-phosphate synthase/GTP cyclohydrolase II
MVPANNAPRQTAFTVSIEARTGVTTGISAADRARTIAVAADPELSRRHRLARPRLPAARRARAGWWRAGHTEAAVDSPAWPGSTPRR